MLLSNDGILCANYKLHAILDIKDRRSNNVWNRRIL